VRRTLLVLTVAAVTIAASSCAAGPETAASAPPPAATSAPAATENVEQAIRQLVTERDQAIQRGDAAAIARIYADDYVATSAAGLVRTKSQVIEDLKSGAIKIESITGDEINVRAHGETAIVTGRHTTKGRDRGRDASGQFRFTQVYLRRDGRWQLAVFHYSRIGQ
jgi:uncharacterized protein (TIGR02246 family)